MTSALELVLGIMTALGGFVDIGELVFTLDAGSRFGYAHLWVVVLGTIGIIVFCEMSGRISAVLKKPTFELIRERMGRSSGFAVLVASNIVNLLTCTAEIGGIAIVLQLLTGASAYRYMLLAAAALLFLTLYFLKFRWLERLFGLLGLILLVYLWVAVAAQPDWSQALKGLVPRVPADDTLLHLYFVVGLFSSILMPYEIYFYASGGIEDKWTVKDLPVNLATSVLGFTLGAVLVMALIIVGATVFMPRGIDPSTLSSAALPAAATYGATGVLLALLGVLFAVGGAAVETALAGAYNVAQFLGWPWGKAKKPREVPRFTATWMVMLVLGLAIAMSGVNPVKIVEFSVIFAVVVLPFTYYAVLRVADDKKLMGKHVNNRFVKAMGWFYFVLICLAAAAAIPLMVVTRMGQG